MLLIIYAWFDIARHGAMSAPSRPPGADQQYVKTSITQNAKKQNGRHAPCRAMSSNARRFSQNAVSPGIGRQRRARY